MDGLEQEIMERAYKYKSDPEIAYRALADYSITEKDPALKNLAETTAEHLKTVLIPYLDSAGESMINFCISQFLWGRSSGIRQGIGNDRLYTVHYGTFGTGYLCLTDKNIHILVAARLTKLLPLYKQGLVVSVLRGVLGERDETSPTKDDESWAISLQSIQDVQRTRSKRDEQEYVALITPAMTWEVYPWANVVEILTSINMAREGIFAQSGTISESTIPNQPGSVRTGANNITAELERLSALREQGQLTEDEFKVAKAKLLGV